MKQCNWVPENKISNWIWLPDESANGEWVMSPSCVLHDKNNLFSLQLHVLDNYYDRKLLDYFSLAFGVRYGPGVEDYYKLWRTWESSVQELAMSDCSAFWKFIATNWSTSTQKLLSGCDKVPVYADGKIILANKEDVFIPDDLLLADLFNQLPQQSFFIWYPSSGLPSMSRTRLNSIYGCLGVQTISKAVEKNDSFSLENGFRTVDPSKVIKVGLLRIILAFLADQALDIPAEERHRMVSCLLNVSVQGIDEPITVGYSLSLSSGRYVDVKASRMIRWERENSKLYLQRRHEDSSGHKDKIEFATHLADEISQGVLFQMTEHISSLSELVKIGCLLDFEDAAVVFLLKSKNLQLFPEDEVFLNTSMQGGSKNH